MIRALSRRGEMQVWVAGTIVQAVGVALLTSGSAYGEPVAVVGSLALLAAAAMFVRLAFKRADE